MRDTATITESFLRCLDNVRFESEPYRHWFLKDVLPEDVCDAIRSLPFEPPRIGDTKGKRETHDSARTFFTADNHHRFEVCRKVAEALRSTLTVRKLEETCGITLKGAFLRIEYCQDTEGFWLEPHTDISEKLFTMLVYMSTDPGSEEWGTDLYDENLNFVGSAPCGFNRGLIFIPGPNTWHGFRKRRIDGVRKLIIVNYVTREWRDRHQLAYHDEPVG